jgi:Ser/Thr protein kinase RdoA (MazF antagonist)
MQSRQQLSQREIDNVLGHYALGSVNSITELAAGSVLSPKVVLETDRGKLLLKRRARGLDLPGVVAFSHEVILGCLQAGVCVPPLIGTTLDNNSIVQFEDHVYELFVFIDGIRFDTSKQMIGSHAHQAGALLAELHTALDTIEYASEPSIEKVPLNLDRLELLNQSSIQIADDMKIQLSRLLKFGAELITANDRSQAIVHGDWHPGNMIFQGSEIVAVCDFDHTRIGSRTRELAQAMIHFSMKLPTAGESPHQCAMEPDISALHAFWKGYQCINPDAYLPRLCIGLMPAVMIDAALASFPYQNFLGGGDQPDSLLIAVSRKAMWLDEHQSQLISMLEKE